MGQPPRATPDSLHDATTPTAPSTGPTTDAPHGARLLPSGHVAYDFDHGVLYAMAWTGSPVWPLTDHIIPRVLITSTPPRLDVEDTTDEPWIRVRGRRYASACLYRAADARLDRPAHPDPFVCDWSRFYRVHDNDRPVSPTTRVYAVLGAMERHVLDRLDSDMPFWRVESARLQHGCELASATYETARRRDYVARAERREDELYTLLDRLAHPGSPRPAGTVAGQRPPRRCMARQCPNPPTHLVHARHRVIDYLMAFALCLEHATDPSLKVLHSQPIPAAPHPSRPG